MVHATVAPILGRPVVHREVPRGNAAGINPSPKTRVNQHLTGRKQTLSAIAGIYGKDWRTIANANRAVLTQYRDPNMVVPPGINLVIP